MTYVLNLNTKMKNALLTLMVTKFTEFCNNTESKIMKSINDTVLWQSGNGIF